ncbi:kinase-like domain-containing protein [Sparassis latifolia]|uniref:non-specific serine/threonine protein kinase n=1 Tax=Sparassis crispa TaxID=139825 RepID=A0A401GZP0_9APHY|nr:predicted protein [Sparassis crispa]GBE87646.1 predicted protein [Sparassis crispa]
MFDDSEPSSPTSALVALPPLDPEWQPILHVSNQVVLYNPTSHAISVRTQSRSPPPTLVHRSSTDVRCPYCHRLLPADLHAEDESERDFELDAEFDRHSHSRAANYFQLLEIANETASRPVTPTTSSSNIRPFATFSDTQYADSSGNSTRGPNGSAGGNAFRAENMAEGYFKAFFKEECRLGMGANGSVFLCQHVLDGNLLGHFAVKKIAVGQSHSYLLNILREVRLLETLHHPNIITYHHAWLENCQFSSFGPKIPTLHVLMQWAEGGSLDDLIDARLGRGAAVLPHVHPFGSTTPTSPDTPSSPSPSQAPFSRSMRIRAFRAMQRAPPEERERLRREMGLAEMGASGRPIDLKAVHLLSAEEVRGLFGDVVAGLAFLHDKSILHLDLKPGNVLLTWDEGRLIPRAMLSDFGTSQDRLSSRTRSGNTGTLEYTSPESLPSPSTGLLQQVDSKADMWSVGMILHKLLFFRLPYRHASDGDEQRDGRETADILEHEVASYSGFKCTSAHVTAFESRRLPRAYLVLLESLLNVTPAMRPSSERVLSAIREGRLDPIPSARIRRTSSRTSLIPVPVRRLMDAASTALPSGSAELPAPSSQSEVDVGVDVEGSRTPRPGEKHADSVRVPLLGLPMPPSSSSSSSLTVADHMVLRWIYGVLVRGRRIRIGMPHIWARTLKSLVLVTKVSTIAHVCPDSRLHPFVALVFLVLAVVDTWFDGLGPTLVLGLVHVSLIWIVRWSGRGCARVLQTDQLHGLW